MNTKRKKYIHVNGKYVATQDQYGAYEVTLLAGNNYSDINRTVCYYCKDLIEGTNDWLPMIEIALPDKWDVKQIALAFREFMGGVLVNGKPVSYAYALRAEEIFFQHLAAQKK